VEKERVSFDIVGVLPTLFGEYQASLSKNIAGYIITL
jgi:hypothetical protein